MSQASRALSNLRGIVIVIVLAFHSSLAYLVSVPDQGARFDQAPYNWQAFPIVDTHRWIGFDVFCAWQDVSLMSLMFLLSALFVAPSLLRKGLWTYVMDRVWRIGLPFVLVILFLSPLALYPAYSIRTVDPSLVGFLAAVDFLAVLADWPRVVFVPAPDHGYNGGLRLRRGTWIP